MKITDYDIPNGLAPFTHQTLQEFALQVIDDVAKDIVNRNTKKELRAVIWWMSVWNMCETQKRLDLEMEITALFVPMLKNPEVEAVSELGKAVLEMVERIKNDGQPHDSTLVESLVLQHVGLAVEGRADETPSNSDGCHDVHQLADRLHCCRVESEDPLRAHMRGYQPVGDASHMDQGDPQWRLTALPERSDNKK